MEGLVALAADIARDAGELAKKRRTEGVAVAATKSTFADIVTEADREVEDLIRARLRAERPQDGFLGEESGAAESGGEITWVVDPIDGTVNYAYGMPSYGVSIAAVSGGNNPQEWSGVASAVFAPALGELFTAARGEGAWLDGKRLSVSTVGSAGALIGTGFGYDPATHDGDLAAVRRVMPLARDLRRVGAASLDLCYVGAGRLDGYFERGLKPWDFAGGALVVEEAGGVFSRFEPEAPRPLVITGSAGLHDALCEVLGVGAARG